MQDFIEFHKKALDGLQGLLKIVQNMDSKIRETQWEIDSRKAALEKVNQELST